MIGPVIVFASAVALVATYIFTVNRLLRSDEHWNETNHAAVTPDRAPAKARAVVPALAPRHA